MKKLFAGVLVLVLLCLQTASAETQISNCTEINYPGYYNLTGDLTGFKEDMDYCIGIFASDVILGGNGHSLIGPGYGKGIYVYSVSNVTIENLTVSRYGVGIYLNSSSNNTITNVTANNNMGGIVLFSSSNNTIKDSVLQNNGLFVWQSYNNIVESTTVNGKPLVYLENEENRVVDNAGQVILVNCANITVKDLDLSNATVGVELWGSEWIRIENVTANNNYYGIYLYSSNNNTITNLTANNNYAGVVLFSSSNNTIKDSVLQNNGLVVIDSYNNIVESTTVNGKPLVYLENEENRVVDNAGQVILVNCANITVKDLDLSNATVGVELWGSEWIRIENVTANNNYDGILLYSSSNNTIKDSVLQNNSYGIVLDYSGNNLIYNNYFNNTNNVTISESQPNTWNVTKTEGANIVGGNYLGGNYWGSPNGDGFSDVCGDSDSDGICDRPFAIDDNNVDYLPLAKMFTVSGFISYTGDQSGKIYVCAIKNLEKDSPPDYCTEASAQKYSLRVASGSYYIAAFMDVNGNAHPDSAEPIGFAIEKKYPENADQIEVSRDISNVNITLYDVDLNISEVRIYPSQPIVGQQITLNATIRNLGGSFAENFNVSVYVNGQLVDTKTISLYFNETKYVEFVSPLLDAGVYSVRIAVDPDDAVYESDESNNEYSLSLYVDYEIIEETWRDPFNISIEGMTSFDSLPVDDPSDGINWTKVDLPSDCKSGAGNSTFIMVRRGSENNLLIYLEGGGACLDYNTCGGPTSTVTTLDPEFDSGPRPLKSTYVRGIFDVSNPLNPFRNWTIVFIPYSTGDIHVGNRVVRYYNVSNPTQNKTIYHVGYVNAIVAMRWINSSGNFDKIVVSGSSAGGFGTILHFYRASEIFNKPIIAINDAGPGTQANATSPFRNQILFDRWGIQQNYPPDSLQYFENSDPLRFLNWALNESLGGCGNCIYALFEDQWDIVIGPYFQGYSFTDYQARLLSLISSIKANFSDRFCAYLPLSTYHTAFAGGYNYPVGDRFYALNIDGYRVWQWIGDVLSGNCRDAIDLGQRDLPPAPTPTPTTPTPTPTPIPTTPRPPPVGGGGGGGGYIPGTGVYYTARELVKAGESYEIAMPQSVFIETGVLSITVTPREDTTVQLRVERLKELPPGIPRPEGLAVLILSIEPRTGVETSLSGKIKFGVSIEEIKAKGFDPNLVTVILMRWDGSRWTELPTKFLSSDGKYNYYEAETPGFSYFEQLLQQNHSFPDLKQSSQLQG